MSDLKILIVGVNKKHSLERIYLKHLKKLDVKVDIFDIRTYIDDYRKSTLNKIWFKLDITSIYNKIGNILMNHIDSYRPNVILVFKGMELNSRTIKKIKRRNIFLINYNPDHPFVFSGSGSGNKNVFKNGKHYDLYLTYGEVISKQIEAKFGVASEILPFGYELGEEIFSKIEEEDEINKVCFIGHADKIRADQIFFLAKNKIPIAVYGKNWSKYLKEKNNLEINDTALYGIDYWKVLRKYRVQLNLFRKHNNGSHNMRSFEIPAVGGIMLSPSKSDHIKFFEKNKIFFEFSNNEDLIRVCKRLLSMDIKKINNIRINARKASEKGHHTYFFRSKELLAIIEKYV